MRSSTVSASKCRGEWPDGPPRGSCPPTTGVQWRSEVPKRAGWFRLALDYIPSRSASLRLSPMVVAASGSARSPTCHDE